MKVWILSRGCRYEGGSVDSIYGTEENGLKAAEKIMQWEVTRTAELSTPDDQCETTFEKQPLDNGNHYWVEHCRWRHENDEWIDADSDFISLTWYELQ